MARFRGKIGITRGPEETSPGIFSQRIEEVEVSGEMRNASAGWSAQSLAETVRAKHLLSIITPEESDIDFNEVVYIIWKGHKWSIVSIQYKRPRVELTLGGRYNG